MYKYLLEMGLSVIIVVSKIDKLSNNELFKSTSSISKDFF
jgi:GTP-binding protein EngB required for normal cell division